MSTSKIIKIALVNAVLAAVYIALVVTGLINVPKFEQTKPVLAGIAFLMTFVISAAVMAITVFGRPLMWYLDGLKKEAVKLVFYTLGFLFSALLSVFAILLLYK